MVELQFLGTSQDAGVPQLGCNCENCDRASKYKMSIRSPASLAIYTKKRVIVVDASPLISNQVQQIRPRSKNPLGFDGIILTHLHIGHYLGLLMLGREVASTDKFSVYLTEMNLDFLENNKPFNYLIRRGQIEPIIISVDQPFSPDDSCTIEPFNVIHRNEDGDTIGLSITDIKSGRNAIYIPDMDKHSNFTDDKIKNADITILDGTFYSDNEIPRQEHVPHPPILDTINRFGTDWDHPIYFTHFNHTNPILHNSDFQKTLGTHYFIAEEGQRIDLS